VENECRTGPCRANALCVSSASSSSSTHTHASARLRVWQRSATPKQRSELSRLFVHDEKRSVCARCVLRSCFLLCPLSGVWFRPFGGPVFLPLNSPPKDHVRTRPTCRCRWRRRWQAPRPACRWRCRRTRWRQTRCKAPTRNTTHTLHTPLSAPDNFEAARGILILILLVRSAARVFLHAAGQAQAGRWQGCR
jgi:hypothetical protein